MPDLDIADLTERLASLAVPAYGDSAADALAVHIATHTTAAAAADHLLGPSR